MKILPLLAILASAATAVAQSNDSFSNRTRLTGAEVSVTGSNSGATKEAGEPTHAENAGGSSVWWSWTAPASGNVTISTAGSSVDTLLAVYTGGTLNDLTLVAQNDDAGGGSTSAVTFAAVEGATYAIAVDGYNEGGAISTGSIQLAITASDNGGGGDGGVTFRKAVYNGLVSNAEDLTHQNSGYVTITTTDRGNYTARLTVGGQRYTASGKFDTQGAATSTIRGRGQNSLELNLQLADEGDSIVGTLTGGDWAADVVADRAIYDIRSNPAPRAGRYTLILPGAEDSTAAPGGTSIGTLTVTTGGQIRFAGSLADGTKVTQSAILSGREQWPLYASLYGGQGSLIGWLTFNPEAEDDIYGPVSWFKLPAARSRNYKDGFTLNTTALGSAFQSARNTPVLSLADGQLVLEGGGLAEPIVEGVSLNTRNQFTSSTGNKNVKLTVTPTTGLIKGNLPVTGSRQKLAINAVVLQKQGYAAGYFLNGSQSGAVTIEPAATEPGQ
jgi:hypothetical protein